MYFNNTKYDPMYPEIKKSQFSFAKIKKSFIFPTLQHATKTFTIPHHVQH